MRSIKARFKHSKKQDPEDLIGNYLHFAVAVMGRGLGREAIVKNFRVLVPQDEYVFAERKELIDHLVSLSKVDLSTPKKDQKML